MKRYSAVRILIQALSEEDVAIFIGESLSAEAFLYDRPGNVYLCDYNDCISLGLGIAMCSDKNVFIFCEDSYFIRNISESLQIGVSRCKNIFLVILISGYYLNIGKHPTITKSIMSLNGLLFNMGFMVHDYKRHFKNSKNPVKEIRAIWSKINGPMAVLLDVDSGVLKTSSESIIPYKDSLKNLSSFITRNQDSPILFEDVVKEE